ncbi:dephospho-CoA kinase family [Striga asiatica]|uniref:Dephospho-CoA kinase family n=1 Tax=Striga asiatica TaxID=4170 RepID=A0A5A7NXK0_STRAF|nr:dephospho-CoA kinase family [Striga asiatica]
MKRNKSGLRTELLTVDRGKWCPHLYLTIPILDQLLAHYIFIRAFVGIFQAMNEGLYSNWTRFEAKMDKWTKPVNHYSHVADSEAQLVLLMARDGWIVKEA